MVRLLLLFSGKSRSWARQNLKESGRSKTLQQKNVPSTYIWGVYINGWEGLQIWSIEILFKLEVQTIKVIPKALKSTLERPNWCWLWCLCSGWDSLQAVTTVWSQLLHGYPQAFFTSQLWQYTTTLSHIKLRKSLCDLSYGIYNLAQSIRWHIYPTEKIIQGNI